MLLPLGELTSPLHEEIELWICIALIATFGVSHGAIDNHLYGVKERRDNFGFIAIYLLAAAGFGLLWYLDGRWAFMLFMIISAYHFGQSQFIDLKEEGSWTDPALYFTWGVWLLSGYSYLNSNEFLKVAESPILEGSIALDLLHYAGPLWVFSGILLLATFSLKIYRRKISTARFLAELYQGIIIMGAFYISSPLLGFSLYFIILHSLRVLWHEYQYLEVNLTAFIKMLLPFTLLSLVGMGLLLWIINFFALPLSLPLSALIFISCLTFPHSIVMEAFYQKVNAGSLD